MPLLSMDCSRGDSSFSLIESKVTTLADALRKAQNFIQAIEISIRDDFVWQDAWKRVGEYNDLQSNKPPRKGKEMVG